MRLGDRPFDFEDYSRQHGGLQISKLDATHDKNAKFKYSATL